MLDRLASKPAPLALGLAVLYLVYYLAVRVQLSMSRRNMARENNCKPLLARISPKDPFFGLDIMAETNKWASKNQLLDLVYSRFHKYGRTYASRMIETPAVMTIEPENVKTVLSLRFKDYVLSQRLRLFGDLIGKGVFTTDHEEWHNSRSLIRPNFVRDQVADIGAFERHFQLFLKALPPTGQTVDLQELFFQITIDSATEFLFGESVHSLKRDKSDENNIDKSFAWAFNYAQLSCVKRFRYGVFGFLYRDKDLKQAIQICHEYVDQYVDQAVQYREQEDLEKGTSEKKAAEKYVFLYELAKSTRDRTRLRSEVLNVLLAGRDTTASLLSNMFFQLAKRPEIWAKLRQEIIESVGDEPPTYEQLRGLKYLKYCLNESLRLHPVVPGNSRMAIRDTILPLGGGADGKSPILIPNGTVVTYSVWTMHRETRFFGDDALEFRPERWENLRTGWEYLPFNGGPRICVGQQYALTEAGYVTARLAQSFSKLDSKDPGPWVELASVTLSSRNGCKVALTPA